MTTTRTYALAIALAATCSLAACGGGEFGDACELPNAPEIEAACGTTGTADRSSATCVDPNNPFCDSRICVRYQGEADFCSASCTPGENSGCPGGSVCESTAGSEQGFCVPDEIFERANAD